MDDSFRKEPEADPKRAMMMVQASINNGQFSYLLLVLNRPQTVSAISLWPFSLGWMPSAHI